MPELSQPSVDVATSFRAALAEFGAEGRWNADEPSSLGTEFRRWSPAWDDEAVFARYVDTLRSDELEDTPRPSGKVPCTTWWWTERTEWLARIALRHRLTPRLLEVGGHIGYDVRPSARRRGHATAMLAALLPRARAMGIDRALVMCDVDNTGSRAVIEANGGELEDRRGPKLRYWIPT